MVRPYAVKWLKRKKKRNKRDPEEETEDLRPQEEEEEGEREEEDEGEKEEEDEGEADVEGRKKKARVGNLEEKGCASTSDDMEAEGDPGQILPGLPVAPAAPEGPKPGVVFVLEKASLRVGKVGKKEQILSADEHSTFLKRHNLNPAEFRPDILHQALLSILDRPLTKAGRLQGLYVKTDDGELFEVKPCVRLPRTYKRFSGLMYQLKSEKRIYAAGKRDNLFRMIKNPVTRHLPVNARKIGLSYSSEKIVKMPNYVATTSDDTPLVFVVGAMAHGKIEADYVDEFMAVSGYPLSAACCISRICEALEQKWNIL